MENIYKQFSDSHYPKPLNRYWCRITYITMTPKKLMSKTWLELIPPLQFRACVKRHVIVWKVETELNFIMLCTGCAIILVTVTDFFTKFTALTEEDSRHTSSKFCYNFCYSLKCTTN